MTDVVEYLHILVLGSGGLGNDLLDLAHQDGEHKDPEEPGEQHEDDLPVVLGVHLGVLANRDGRLGGKEETLDVCVANTIINELV